MSAPEFEIRAARPADAKAIAELHVAVWRATYRDLAPVEALRKLDVAARLPRWIEMLDKGERTILVAEIDGRIVGIGTAGAATMPELGPRGEILYLYVDRDCSGRGIGAALMRRLASSLKAQGYASVALGVVQGNAAAMAFYRKLGGRAAGSYVDAGPIWRSRNEIVVFDDLDRLITNVD